MFCSQCGIKTDDSAKFCPGCGAPMMELVTVEQQGVPVQQYQKPGQQGAPVQQYQQPGQHVAPVQQCQQPGQQGAPVQQYQQPGQQVAPVQQYQRSSSGIGKKLSIATAFTAIIIYILMLTPLYSISLLSVDFDITVFNSFNIAEDVASVVKNFGWMLGDDTISGIVASVTIFIFISIGIIVGLIIGLVLLIVHFVQYPGSGDRYIPVHFGLIDAAAILLAFVPLFIDTGEYKDMISIHSSPTMIIAAILCVVCGTLDGIGASYNSKHCYEKPPLFRKKNRSMMNTVSGAVQIPRPIQPTSTGYIPTPAESAPAPVSSAPAPVSPAPAPVSPTPAEEEKTSTEWICSRCGTRNKTISDICKRCETKRDE